MAWQLMTGDVLLSTVLLLIGLGLTLATWVSQTPQEDPVAYARWLVQAQADFGRAVPFLRTVGLFRVTRSLVMRTLFALLGAALILRLVEGVDRLRGRERPEPPREKDWRPAAGESMEALTAGFKRRRYRVVADGERVCVDRWPWADLLPLLAYAGGLLLLIGLLVTSLWSWRVEDVIVRSGERVTVSDGRGWVALSADGEDVRSSAGVRVSRQERLPGVRVAAALDAGDPLLLKRAPEDPASAELTLPLSEEPLIAVLETPWVIRLAPQTTEEPGDAPSPVLVQVYRSPPGQLAMERVVHPGDPLSWEGVRVSLAPVPYARVTAVSDPGLWPATIGLVLLVTGLVGGVFWPQGRFWLRTRADSLEWAGATPRPSRDEGA
jgi:hypothetical protein